MHEVGQGVLSGTSNLACSIWFEMVLYAEFDYIRNVLIRSICDYLRKGPFFANCSKFNNNLYNGSVEVSDTAL